VVAAAAERATKRVLYARRHANARRAGPLSVHPAEQGAEMGPQVARRGIFALFAGVQNIELKLNGKDTKGNHMVGV